MSHVLVIDDRASNREFLSALLGYRGHQVSCAIDGDEGLRLSRELRPDLIICDVLMPVMDGYQFVHQLRTDPDLADIEVVFCTAYFHENEAYRLARQCGVRHILSKPCEAEEVLALVDTLLSPAQSSPAVAVQPDEQAFQQARDRVVLNRLVATQDDLDRSDATLGALVELSLALASAQDTDELLQRLCAGACELLQARYSLALVGGGGTFLPAQYAARGVDAVVAELSVRQLLATSPLARVQSRGELLRIEGSGEDARRIGLPESFPAFSAALAVPIAATDRRYGWLLVADPQHGGGFPAAAPQWLLTLSAHAGRVYENHALFQRAQRHADQLQAEVILRTGMQRRIELQYAIARVFVEAGGFEQAAPILLRTLCERLDFDQAVLWERGRRATRLRRVDVCDFRPGLGTPASECDSSDDGVVGRCWNQAEPVWSDVDRVNAPRRNPALTELAFPVCLHERMIGVVELRCSQYRPPSSELLDSLLAVGSQIAQFLERRSQHAQILRLNRIHAVLSSINATIVRIADRDELLNRACEIAVSEGQFDVAWILLPEVSGGPLAVAAQAVAAGCAGTLATAEAEGYPQALAERAMRSGESVSCNDLLNAEPQAGTAAALRAGERAYIALPLQIGGRPVGVMSLYSRDPGVFETGEVVLLNELAEDISFALSTIETREALSFLERFDPLTGLLNRDGLLDRLRAASAGGRPGESRLAVVCFDIKRFRHINETFGRGAGDQVLREFSRRLRKHWPDPTCVARIGNDLFAALLSGLRDPSEVQRQLQRWPGSDLGGPFRLREQPLVLGSRAGVALYPDHASEAELLLGQAEAALLDAKRSGQDLRFFETAMSERMSSSLLLESRLRRALATQQLRLHYQPKLALASGDVTGVEALLRWQDPEQGLILPQLFVPLLEETGLILEVGLWAMQQALRDLQAAQQRGSPLRRVAVNVSPIQLTRADFVASVRQVLQPYADSPVGLDLEITESLIMEDVEANVGKLAELRTMQVRTAIDDFGTGYSSLAYLARLPVDALKIDRAFVDTMTHSKESAAIVATTISLAHSLGLRVIAEGVETEPQLQQLRELGCDEVQGFLLARPQPAEAAAVWQGRL